MREEDCRGDGRIWMREEDFWWVISEQDDLRDWWERWEDEKAEIARRDERDNAKKNKIKVNHFCLPDWVY